MFRGDFSEKTALRISYYRIVSCLDLDPSDVLLALFKYFAINWAHSRNSYASS